MLDDQLLAGILQEEFNRAAVENNDPASAANINNRESNSQIRARSSQDRMFRQQSYQSLRLQRQSSSTGTILAKMARVFDQAKFYEHTECIICLEEFK